QQGGLRHQRITTATCERFLRKLTRRRSAGKAEALREGWSPCLKQERLDRARRLPLCLGLGRLALLAFAVRLEFGVLLWRQDRFRFLHVFRFARFRATSFVMLGHDLVHLRLLIRR